METIGEYLASRESAPSSKVKELFKMGILEALYNHSVPHSLRSEGWWACDRSLYDRVVGRLRMLEAARPVFKELGGPESMTVFRQVLRTLVVSGEVEMDSVEAASHRMGFIFYKLTEAGKDTFETHYRLLITEQLTLMDFSVEPEADPS